MFLATGFTKTDMAFDSDSWQSDSAFTAGGFFFHSCAGESIIPRHLQLG
jgi:hypothetical protein